MPRQTQPRHFTAYQLLRSSRSFKKTVRGSGSASRSGNDSRSRAITAGLRKRINVLISRSSAMFVTMAWSGSCSFTWASNALAPALSGSRSSVNARLFDSVIVPGIDQRTIRQTRQLLGKRLVQLRRVAAMVTVSSARIEQRAAAKNSAEVSACDTTQM